jgi:tRNA(Phe) wybutosine-synthesizing methylase Tyw3
MQKRQWKREDLQTNELLVVKLSNERVALLVGKKVVRKLDRVAIRISRNSSRRLADLQSIIQDKSRKKPE